MNRVCKNCDYFEEEKEKYNIDPDVPAIGVCHRFPHSKRVYADYWCGEFKPKGD